jgi:hypothetical protein
VDHQDRTDRQALTSNLHWRFSAAPLLRVPSGRDDKGDGGFVITLLEVIVSATVIALCALVAKSLSAQP